MASTTQITSPQILPPLAGKPFVRVYIDSRLATFQCEPEVQFAIKQIFSYTKPGVEFSSKVRDGSWDGRYQMMCRGRVATGLFLAMREELEAKYDLRVVDHRIPLEFGEAWVSDREYQNEGTQAMIDASSTGGLVLMATGTGKTAKVVGMFFKRLRGWGCFVVDELSLLAQAKDALERELGERVGTVGKSKFEPHRITVATIQTLARHQSDPNFRNWFSRLDAVIIDEVHVALNRRNIDIVQKIQPRAVYGLTATLQMRKEHVRVPAIALCGPVIFEYGIKTGVAEGYLNSGKIIQIRFNDPLAEGEVPGYWSTKRDAESHKIVKIFIPSKSVDAQYRYHIALNRARNDLIEALVRGYIKVGRHVVVLVERKNHLAVLSHRVCDIRHAALSGDVPSAERLLAMRRMDSDKLPLIIASRVFSKGVDIKSVDCIIDCTAQPGADGAMQRYGRGVRNFAGKRELLYVNISDVGNPFEFSAKQRSDALQETGATVYEVRTVKQALRFAD